ncbi:molecular chaperone Hsp33 [Carboxydocella sporoproducens DSM 16521]|uniref:33 kDa chaperonin n=2 Tax=Carboxydocella TaxID=178898 RepID=A0A1T4NAJ0_9FIRM|nr:MULTISPECIES: Hsp33 family molecular chaperone HslO [Carboxydocella]AVX20964.1 molecular chaperone Hsp33 [Carboxydocella thermautotrophica]SJZ76116.1 molecular chaperone Hsp33 [Carboxydocella sporoproducens DSM 16521]
MQNELIRGIAAGGQIRALALTATRAVEEARQRHDTWPTATAALGRCLMAVALLGATLKNEETVTLRIFGDGPIGGIITQADAEGNLRGYVQEPHVDLPPKGPGKLDVGRAVGQGQLYFTRDLGLKEPYTGTSPLVSGEIAEDLTHYFAKSEQIPSVVALGVLVAPEGHVQAAGGFLLQLMPGATEEVINALEANLAQLPPVSSQVAEGARAEDLLQQALQGFDFQILERKEVRFACRCSRERMSGILLALGWKELAEMAAEGGAELRCHFCNEKYHFSKAELEQLMFELNKREEK